MSGKSCSPAAAETAWDREVALRQGANERSYKNGGELPERAAVSWSSGLRRV